MPSSGSPPRTARSPRSKDQLAAANREIAALKDALAELKTRADQAPAAVAARELTALRDAVRDLRARVDDAQKAKPK